MTKSKHTVDSAIRSINKKSDMRVNPYNGLIYWIKESNRNNDIGVGTWGKVSYLVNHQNFRILVVDKFPKL